MKLNLLAVVLLSGRALAGIIDVNRQVTGTITTYSNTSNNTFIGTAGDKTNVTTLSETSYDSSKVIFEKFIELLGKLSPKEKEKLRKLFSTQTLAEYGKDSESEDITQGYETTENKDVPLQTDSPIQNNSENKVKTETSKSDEPFQPTFPSKIPSKPIAAYDDCPCRNTKPLGKESNPEIPESKDSPVPVKDTSYPSTSKDAPEVKDGSSKDDSYPSTSKDAPEVKDSSSKDDSYPSTSKDAPEVKDGSSKENDAPEAKDSSSKDETKDDDSSKDETSPSHSIQNDSYMKEKDGNNSTSTGKNNTSSQSDSKEVSFQSPQGKSISPSQAPETAPSATGQTGEYSSNNAYEIILPTTLFALTSSIVIFTFSIF
jgi:hypothetical protein